MESVTSPTITQLRKTPLNPLHRRLAAKMVNFDGWDMPVEYPSSGGLIAEHRAHRLGEEDYLLVINAGTREKDIRWVRENTKSFDCVVEDLSDAYTQLAIQGPRAVEVLQELTDAKLNAIKNYWFTHGALCGLKNILIARTGYTGEDGFEIYVPSDRATSEEVWAKVMEAGRQFGIVPCGLGARNTLRLEAKMALYGHEISDKINVWEAGLDRYCKMEKGDFIGRAALERARAAGLTRTLVGLEMIDRGIARDDYGVYNEAGEAVGVITSGSPSPTLGKNIALAYVPPPLAPLGTTLYVEIRTQRCKARVVPTPFYKRPKRAAAPQTAKTA